MKENSKIKSRHNSIFVFVGWFCNVSDITNTLLTKTHEPINSYK